MGKLQIFFRGNRYVQVVNYTRVNDRSNVFGWFELFSHGAFIVEMIESGYSCTWIYF